MAQFQIVYFTHSPTLPGQNPWWGPYAEFVEAASLGEAREIADSRYGDCHIEYVRECDSAGQPLLAGER